ncbi:MAG: FCD domain-containing protein, partial [Rhodospirillales bacterium]|nr:FCD domain-containing protein [Rhodospirillales bacterium]
MPLPSSPEFIKDLVEIHALYSDAVDEGKLRKIHKLNNKFHSAIYATCENPFLSETIDRLFWLTTAMRSY